MAGELSIPARRKYVALRCRETCANVGGEKCDRSMRSKNLGCMYSSMIISNTSRGKVSNVGGSRFRIVMIVKRDCIVITNIRIKESFEVAEREKQGQICNGPPATRKRWERAVLSSYLPR